MMLTPEISFNGWHVAHPARVADENLIADLAFERIAGHSGARQ
jgi:hypothetical protein